MTGGAIIAKLPFVKIKSLVPAKAIELKDNKNVISDIRFSKNMADFMWKNIILNISS
jgi:hypothetical protein